jgi:hypothetical protein
MIRIEGQQARYWISLMARYRRRDGTELSAIQPSDEFLVIQDADDAPITGQLLAKKGCYLVRTDAGILYPVTAENFEAAHEQIHQGEKND